MLLRRVLAVAVVLLASPRVEAGAAGLVGVRGFVERLSLQLRAQPPVAADALAEGRGRQVSREGWQQERKMRARKGPCTSVTVLTVLTAARCLL